MLKCFFPAWIYGWVIIVFLPSAVIAYLGLWAPAAAIGTGFDNFAATLWRVADDVSPIAKLSLGGVLLAGFFLATRVRSGAPFRYVAGFVAGVSAAALVAAAIPAEHARAFGVGLAGVRFDPLPIAIYLGGGACAGLVFMAAFDRCRRAKTG